MPEAPARCRAPTLEITLYDTDGGSEPTGGATGEIRVSSASTTMAAIVASAASHAARACSSDGIRSCPRGGLDDQRGLVRLGRGGAGADQDPEPVPARDQGRRLRGGDGECDRPGRG